MLKHFLSLLGTFRGKRKKGQKKFVPPDDLSVEIMEKVRKEAEFLKNMHNVNVQNLKKGEIPVIPKQADK